MRMENGVTRRKTKLERCDWHFPIHANVLFRDPDDLTRDIAARRSGLANVLEVLNCTSLQSTNRVQRPRDPNVSPEVAVWRPRILSLRSTGLPGHPVLQIYFLPAVHQRLWLGYNANTDSMGPRLRANDSASSYFLLSNMKLMH